MREYGKIEDQLLTYRECGKQDMEEFLEHTAIAKHTDILTKLRRNDARIKSDHQVLYKIVYCINVWSDVSMKCTMEEREEARLDFCVSNIIYCRGLQEN